MTSHGKGKFPGSETGIHFQVPVGPGSSEFLWLSGIASVGVRTGRFLIFYVLSMDLSIDPPWKKEDGRNVIECFFFKKYAECLLCPPLRARFATLINGHFSIGKIENLRAPYIGLFVFHIIGWDFTTSDIPFLM